MAEKMTFDRERYLQESTNNDFVAAKKAYDAERYEEAKKFFEIAYRNGNVLAGVRLGILYFRGYGCVKNRDKAFSLFEEGARRGCPLGADWLAECYRNGLGVEKSAKKAAEISNAGFEALLQMAEAGSDDALYSCGYLLLHGDLVEADEEKGLQYLESAMEQGNVNAAVELAKAYLYGWGTESDEQRCLEILNRYEGTSNPDIHFGLGLFYLNESLGPETDYAKALEHLLIPAKAGNVAAQRAVGVMYAQEENLRNFEEAEKWLCKVAQSEDRYALIELADLYQRQDNPKRDWDKAAECFEKVEHTMADEEDVQADETEPGELYYLVGDLCYRLYEDDEHVNLALDYYCRALSHGYRDAIYEVCLLYFKEARESRYCRWSAGELLRMLRETAEATQDPRMDALLDDIYGDADYEPWDTEAESYD